MDIYKKMRNLIKKILKEDDFQWMRDIEPQQPLVLGDEWVIENDIHETDPFMTSVQEKLFDLGYVWAHGSKYIYIKLIHLVLFLLASFVMNTVNKQTD